ENLQLLTALGQNIPAATHPNNRKGSTNLQLSQSQEARPISPVSNLKDTDSPYQKWLFKHKFHIFALIIYIFAIVAAIIVCPTQVERGVAFCYFSIGIVAPTFILLFPICCYYFIRESFFNG
ncbi:unnamed protein product, partial [Meganyctiphanes norvegica]